MYYRPHSTRWINKDTILFMLNKDQSTFRLVVFGILLYWNVASNFSAEFYIRRINHD